jgi:hypothetical protein
LVDHSEPCARSDRTAAPVAFRHFVTAWPFEFDDPSQQPIETLAPYRTLADRVGNLPDRVEAAIANVCGFDYVLLMEADAVPDLPADRFRRLDRSGFAALYTITHCKDAT